MDKCEQKKKAFYDYYFKLNGNIIKVCKTFFLNTLTISERRIYYYFDNIHIEENGIQNKNRRANCGRKGTPQNKVQEVVDHISNFPTIDSHYCRTETSRNYLETHLNITKMYKLYKEIYENPVSAEIYRQIFNTKFSLSFYYPKKDQCDKCAKYKANQNPSSKEKDEYDAHIQQNTFIKAEREMDRKNIDPRKAVICYDMQNVFSLPRGFVSNFYYKRKLSVFNLTATLILLISKELPRNFRNQVTQEYKKWIVFIAQLKNI